MGFYSVGAETRRRRGEEVFAPSWRELDRCIVMPQTGSLRYEEADGGRGNPSLRNPLWTELAKYLFKLHEVCAIEVLSNCMLYYKLQTVLPYKINQDSLN